MNLNKLWNNKTKAKPRGNYKEIIETQENQLKHILEEQSQIRRYGSFFGSITLAPIGPIYQDNERNWFLKGHKKVC